MTEQQTVKKESELFSPSLFFFFKVYSFLLFFHQRHGSRRRTRLTQPTIRGGATPASAAYPCPPFAGDRCRCPWPTQAHCRPWPTQYAVPAPPEHPPVPSGTGPSKALCRACACIYIYTHSHYKKIILHMVKTIL